MAKLVALLLALLALAGCETFRAVEAAVPALEVCFVYKGQKLCAVKREGKWFLSADLSAEEKAEVLENLPR